MNHVTEDLAAYRAGELTPLDRARVREHLDSCAACRAELGELENLWELLGETAHLAPPTGSVWPAIRARTTTRKHGAWPGVAWATAALVAGVLIGVSLPGSGSLMGEDGVTLAGDENSWLESSWLQRDQDDDLASGWLLAGNSMSEDGS